jgi:hypothetical protein
MATRPAARAIRAGVLSNGPVLFGIDDRTLLLDVCGGTQSKRRTCQRRPEQSDW